jgi:hypothetical protein
MTPPICSIFSKYIERVHGLSNMGDFLHAREANEICAESETCPLSGCNTDTRAHRVKNGEHHRGQDGQGRDLIERQRLLGDEDSGGRNDQTLN